MERRENRKRLCKTTSLGFRMDKNFKELAVHHLPSSWFECNSGGPGSHLDGWSVWS